MPVRVMPRPRRSLFAGELVHRDSYRAPGDLNFDFTLPAGEAPGYRRQPDLCRALAAVGFKSGRLV